MEKDELIKIVDDVSKPIPLEKVPEALQLFRTDAYRNKYELFSVYSHFVRRVPINTEKFSAQEYHMINQLYIQYAISYEGINKEELSSLYIRNIDYYTSMNATDEAIRYANLVLDIEDLPNIFYMIALSFMLTLVKDSTVKTDAMPYLEKYLSLFEDSNLDKNTYFIMRMNLIEAYIKLNMPKEFFKEVQYFEKLITDEIDADALNMAKLLILAGNIALNDADVTNLQISDFMDICRTVGQNPDVSSNLMGFLPPLISKIRGHISDEALVRSLLMLLNNTRSTSDKIALYEYLIGRLKIDRTVYPEIYDNYFILLRRYYHIVTAFSFQEAISEIKFDKQRKYANQKARKQGMSSVGVIYLSMQLINLQNDTFDTLKASGFTHLNQEAASGVNAAHRLQQVMTAICSEEYTSQILEFCDLETLDQRINACNTISIEFESTIIGWIKARFIVVRRDKANKIEEVIYTLELIDEQKNRERKLKYLSETDWLTGIKNRGIGEVTIQSYLFNKVYGMLCIIDVDNFKSFNDSFGHATGDNVIRCIASTINNSFKEKDLVFRLGGDEFAVFAVDVTDKSSARKIMQQLFEAIDSIDLPELQGEKLSISVGATFFTSDIEVDFDSLYKKADAGTYKSKTIEGNSCTYID